MTLKDIFAAMPSNGSANGYDLNIKGEINIIDHQLNDLYITYSRQDDPFRAGMVAAVESMFVAMTLDQVEWSVIKNAIQAIVTGYNI